MKEMLAIELANATKKLESYRANGKSSSQIAKLEKKIRELQDSYFCACNDC